MAIDDQVHLLGCSSVAFAAEPLSHSRRSVSFKGELLIRLTSSLRHSRHAIMFDEAELLLREMSRLAVLPEEHLLNLLTSVHTGVTRLLAMLSDGLQLLFSLSLSLDVSHLDDFLEWIATPTMSVDTFRERYTRHLKPLIDILERFGRQMEEQLKLQQQGHASPHARQFEFLWMQGFYRALEALRGGWSLSATIHPLSP